MRPLRDTWACWHSTECRFCVSVFGSSSSSGSSSHKHKRTAENLISINVLPEDLPARRRTSLTLLCKMSKKFNFFSYLWPMAGKKRLVLDFIMKEKEIQESERDKTSNVRIT